MREDISKHIIVKYIEDSEADSVKSELSQLLNVRELHSMKKMEHSGVELLRLHEDDDLMTFVHHLNMHPGTHYAQLNHKLFPFSAEDFFDKQWGLCNKGLADAAGDLGMSGIDINVVPAWEITKGDENVLVAVLDTGTDIYHDDLKSNVAILSGVEPALDTSKWDFAEGDKEGFISPVQSTHGTMTAGIIAGNGKTGISGVAPNVKFLPLKFMSAEHGYTSDAIEAIEYAEKNGVRIVNCSWGCDTDNPALKFHMQNSSMLFVAAAGNDGNDIGVDPVYPAVYKLDNLITVGAIDNQGNIPMFSNYGSAVDVAAPGAFIYTTVPSPDQNSYNISSGTSLAAPFVSGIAALILSVAPKLTADKIKTVILDSIKEMDSLKGKISSSGLVDAYKALEIAKSLASKN